MGRKDKDKSLLTTCPSCMSHITVATKEQNTQDLKRSLTQVLM